MQPYTKFMARKPMSILVGMLLFWVSHAMEHASTEHLSFSYTASSAKKAYPCTIHVRGVAHTVEVEPFLPYDPERFMTPAIHAAHIQSKEAFSKAVQALEVKDPSALDLNKKINNEYIAQIFPTILTKYKTQPILDRLDTLHGMKEANENPGIDTGFSFCMPTRNPLISLLHAIRDLYGATGHRIPFLDLGAGLHYTSFFAILSGAKAYSIEQDIAVAKDGSRQLQSWLQEAESAEKNSVREELNTLWITAVISALDITTHATLQGIAFPIVYAGSLLHFLSPTETKDLLKAVYSVLEAGGLFFIVTNTTSPYPAYQSYLKAEGKMHNPMPWYSYHIDMYLSIAAEIDGKEEVLARFWLPVAYCPAYQDARIAGPEKHLLSPEEGIQLANAFSQAHSLGILNESHVHAKGLRFYRYSHYKRRSFMPESFLKNLAINCGFVVKDSVIEEVNLSMVLQKPNDTQEQANSGILQEDLQIQHTNQY